MSHLTCLAAKKSTSSRNKKWKMTSYEILSWKMTREWNMASITYIRLLKKNIQDGGQHFSPRCTAMTLFSTPCIQIPPHHMLLHKLVSIFSCESCFIRAEIWSPLQQTTNHFKSNKLKLNIFDRAPHARIKNKYKKWRAPLKSWLWNLWIRKLLS